MKEILRVYPKVQVTSPSTRIKTSLKPSLFSFSFVFRSGLKTVPGNAKVHYNYANLLKEEGKLKLAANHYNQALR